MPRPFALSTLAFVAGLVRRVGDGASAIVYPPVCVACGVMTERHGALCAACWRAVRFLDQPWCEVMGEPFGHDPGDGVVSLQAIARPPPYARARAAVAYEGVARSLVHSLKYADRADLAPLMASWMIRAGRELIDCSDVVVPVPLHRGRMFERRYNQSAELARALAGTCSLPMLAGVLLRVRATRQQVGLGLRARQENVRSAFAVDSARRSLLEGRRVLLVDDVLTTGSTLESATRALLKAGVTEVKVLTFARVASDEGETLYA